MIFLPIIERELRVAARRPATHRIRFYAFFLATLIILWQLLDLTMNRPLPVLEQGRKLFHFQALFAFFYCLLIGAQVTADCLSEEKRQETLGLLFLTHLQSLDIVLGKLVANSLNAVYGLLTILPLLALPLLMGGVAAGEFWRLALALLNLLFFSLATGMLVSSASRNARQAMFASVTLVYAVVTGPLAMTLFLDDSNVIVSLLALSPAFSFAWIFLTRGIVPPNVPDLYWVSLGFCFMMSWFVLFRASAVLRGAWANQGAVRRRHPLPEWIEQKSYGIGTARRQHRAGLLDQNPFLWLAARDRWKPRYVWLLVGAVVLTWFWGYSRHHELMFDFGVVISTVLMLNVFIKIWVASEATTRLTNDYRSGTLELLLSTPLSTMDIVHGQWLAIRRQFAWPLLVLIVLEFLLLLKILTPGPTLAVVVMLVADCLAASWVGMWLAFRSKNPGRAVGTTVFLVLMLPWIILLAGLQAIEWLTHTQFAVLMAGQGTFDVVFTWQVYGWLAIGLICDLALGFGWARTRLKRDFRLAAMQRYFPGPGRSTG
jgi:ABC-type Na+ efflux pump permease subunit